MGMEDQIGWDYFGATPETSPRMQEHMDWHMAPENMARTGNYGERFLLFHEQYVGKFDVYRASRGLLPVTKWDPATAIPPGLSHDHVLMAGRDTSFPYSVNPACKTPTWATINGGTDPDPLYGHTRLGQFQSLDELGRAIDSDWHGTVHNTIGGDMASFSSPIDPIFWRWHKWIDGIRQSWNVSQTLSNLRVSEIASFVTILFGVTNDAPGVVIGPDGIPHPVPGGPGDPWLAQVSPAVRDVMTGLAVGEMASLISDKNVRAQIQEVSRGLVTRQAQSLFTTPSKVAEGVKKTIAASKRG